jgi:hypothetical protein
MGNHPVAIGRVSYNAVVDQPKLFEKPMVINMPAIELKSGNLIRVKLFSPNRIGELTSEQIVSRIGDGVITVIATKDQTDKMRSLSLKDAVRFWPIDLYDAFHQMFSSHYYSDAKYRNLVENLSDDIMVSMPHDMTLHALTFKQRSAILDFDRKCGAKAVLVFQEYQDIYQLTPIGLGKIRPTHALQRLSYLTRDASFQSENRFPVNSPVNQAWFTKTTTIWKVRGIELLSATSVLPTNIERPPPTLAAAAASADGTTIAATAESKEQA